MNDVMMNTITNFVENKSIHEIMTSLLRWLIDITGCTYGLIGETKYSDSGTQYTRFHAVHGFPETSVYTSRLIKDKYIDFMQPDTLHAKVYQTHKRVVCRDIIAYRLGKPLPPDHPSMKNFALFPLLVSDTVIGVVGLSGDNVDMTEIWADNLEPQLKPIRLTMMLILERRAIESYSLKLLSNVSDELKPHLTGVLRINKMLQNTLLSDEQIELLDIIDNCNIKILEIINDIVDYTKITTGKLTLKLSPFSLKRCVSRVVCALESKIIDDIKFTVDYSSDVDRVAGDEVRLIQILLNLLNNSIKFTKKGQICLSVTTEKADIAHTVLKFVVSDTGIGIPEQRLKHIFDHIANFVYRNDNVGLGLPITEYLVHAYNGTISIDSKESVGTTVTFTLQFNNLIRGYTRKEISDYFNGLYILVVTDKPEIRKKIYNWAGKIYAKPIICSTKEMPIFLMNDTHKYEAIILIIDDTVVDGDITALEKSEHRCFRGIICKTEHLKLLCNTAIENVYINKDLVDALSDIVDQLYHVHLLNSGINIEPYNAIDEIKKNITILIAENNIDEQKSMLIMLNDLGYYNITTAADGLEFYTKLNCHEYDIGFINLEIPIIDGITAVRKYKEKSSDSKVVLIAITSSMSETIRDECYKVGMNGYITKPIDQKELNVALNAIVRKKYRTSR